ncbi:C6 zinc finger domain protein [Fusarium tjaetaba]|uniref:C6 zinc finger domain protein n=1 Tax=Fusarium tjaetaba TaxID=1567544 RepID=A0A8H5QLJ0_9HYPO|nr:C6 zinc finger domain protein [Fusarium tjaetaba]KAF5615966.1 C6 zinc finger domain protein [Fusarium tjaetaba]
MEQPINTQEGTTQPLNETPVVGSSPQDRRASDAAQDRRMSDEWDASKVPPSRFQKRKGSIYATPGSRDGHVDRNYQDKYWSKMTEKNWGSGSK